MSDTPLSEKPLSDTPLSDTPSSENTGPQPIPSQTSPKKFKKRRTWKQRFKLTILVVLILAFSFRIAINILLPTVLRKVANAYNLDCSYSAMDLSVLGGNADIWNLVLRPKAGGESIVDADYIQGKISVLNLLRGRLVVYRAEVDGMKVFIDREPDGSIPLLKNLLASSAPPAAVQPAQPNAKPQSINLQSPLQIDAVRLSHLTTRLRDRSVTPVFDATIRTTVRLSDVGSLDRPTQFELQVSADPVLDSLLVSGQLHNSPTAIDATMSVALRGLHPQSAAGYFLPLGLKPIANDVAADATLRLTATSLPNSADVSAEVSLEKVSVRVDAEEAASLDKLTLNAKRLNATTADLGTLLIDGGRASLHRSPEGAFVFAGLEPISAPVVTSPPQPPAAQSATGVSPTFQLHLDEVQLKNLIATLDDAAVVPATRLQAILSELSVKNIAIDPARPDEKVSIKGLIALPGVLHAITLDGSATPFAASKQLDLNITADGIKPVALDPYLAQLGLESQLSAGRFSGDISATLLTAPDGVLTADARVANIRLQDAYELLAINSASIEGATIDAAQRRIALKSIQVTGPALAVRREKSGALAAFGLRTRIGRAMSASTASQTNLAVPEATAPALVPTTQAASSILPRIELGQFNWQGIKLTFIDEAIEPTATIAVGDAGVDVSDLVLDLAPNAPAKPGKFKAWLSVPNVVNRLNIDGTFTPSPQRLGIAFSVAGEGITASAIAPYVKSFGVLPTVIDGQVYFDAAASVLVVNEVLTLSLSLKNAVYRDGQTELAAADEISVSAIGLSSEGIDIGDVNLQAPRALILRNVDGSLEAGGIRLLQTDHPPGAAAPAATQPAVFKLPTLPIRTTVKSVHLENAAIGWQDNALKPPVSLVARASADIDPLIIGRLGGHPTRFKLAASIDGSVDSATISGTLNTAADAPSVHLEVSADGIRAGAIAAYFPRGIESSLKNGHFSGSVDAAAADNADGGVSADLALNSINLNDGPGAPLLKLEHFALAARRIDPVSNVYAFKEFSTAGIEADVLLGSDGTISASGLRLAPTTQPDIATQPAAPSTDPQQQPTIAATQPATNVMALVADARKPLPLISLDKLYLNVARLTVAGATGPEGAPISLQQLNVRNPSRLIFGGSDIENQPIELNVTGGLSPVVGKFTAAVRVSPLVAMPTLSLDVDATGINGVGLTNVLPQLKSKLDGSALSEGTFHTHVDASINYARRGPRDFDLSRGFAMDIDIKPLQFRSTPQGAIEAGLDEIRSDGIRVEPLTGNVRVKSLEITKPTGRVTRDAAGIHAFGMLLPMSAQPTTAPAALVAEVPAVPEAQTPIEMAPPSPAERPQNEIALDRLTVTGIDVLIEDDTAAPKTSIPLSGLDVDIRDISNQMPFTGKPARFSVLMTADKVPLPPRLGAAPGARASEPPKESAAEPSTNSSTAPSSGPSTQPAYTEPRELFSQITASGKVGIKQTDAGFVLDGWAKTSVNGFELLGVRGLAKQYGVTIGGGVFDDFNDIRFNPSGNIETKNKLVLTNLSLSEPANGPIQRALKISAPIDVAIGLVTDPDGSITLQLPVPVKNGAVSTGDVVGPAIGAVAGVLTTAIASAPIKAVGGIGDLLGMSKDNAAAPDAEIVIPFLPGYAELDANEVQTLRLLAKRLQKEPTLELQIRHELSAADILRAGVRVNPSVQECLVIAAQQRLEKADLLRRRTVLVGQAKGELGSRPESSARETLNRLKSVDAQIAQIENTLDQLYDLTRPGAERQSDRRTRSAALGIGQDRLNAVRTLLVTPSIPNADARVHLSNPQFAPNEAATEGQIVISLVSKKQ